MKKVKNLHFQIKTQNINDIKISKYYSKKLNSDIILISLGLIPYLKHIEFTIDDTQLFGFSIHTKNNKVIKILISSILLTLIKNYSLGTEVGQDCIEEIIKYIK